MRDPQQIEEERQRTNAVLLELLNWFFRDGAGPETVFQRATFIRSNLLTGQLTPETRRQMQKDFGIKKSALSEGLMKAEEVLIEIGGRPC